MFWIGCHFENCTLPAKPSSKERVKCGMYKSIKLNYFEHINLLESCKQPGIHNKSSYYISEMVACVEMKIQRFFLPKKI